MELPAVSVMGQFPRKPILKKRFMCAEIRKCSCDAGLWKEVGWGRGRSRATVQSQQRPSQPQGDGRPWSQDGSLELSYIDTRRPGLYTFHIIGCRLPLKRSMPLDKVSLFNQGNPYRGLIAEGCLCSIRGISFALWRETKVVHYYIIYHGLHVRPLWSPPGNILLWI